MPVSFLAASLRVNLIFSVSIQPMRSRYLALLRSQAASLIRLSGKLFTRKSLTSAESLTSKKDKWEKTLIYWNIKRGLLVSYNPRNSVVARVVIILQECASLPDNCYHLRET